jgi:hypothetical protein
MSIEAVRSRISQIEASVRTIAQAVPRPNGIPGASAGGSFASTLASASGEMFDPKLTKASLAPSGVDPARFSSDVLARLGAPKTEQNLAVMQAWVKAEGTRAQFNPLATTRKAEGATNFNSVGVKNFTTYEQGVDTTIGAITNGLYDDVIAALKRGDDAYAVADAIAASPWGSGGLVRKVLDSNKA